MTSLPTPHTNTHPPHANLNPRDYHQHAFYYATQAFVGDHIPSINPPRRLTQRWPTHYTLRRGYDPILLNSLPCTYSATTADGKRLTIDYMRMFRFTVQCPLCYHNDGFPIRLSYDTCEFPTDYQQLEGCSLCEKKLYLWAIRRNFT